jgi:prefoldin alpha subunit
MQNELIAQLQQLNAQHDAIQEQLQLVTQQIGELSAFREELLLLQTQKNKTALVPLGKGVFCDIMIDSSQKLLVEVGAGYYVRKPFSETISVTEEQTKRLHDIKLQIGNDLSHITQELEQLLARVQGA